MKTKDKIIRMKWSTYKQIRSAFRAKKNEPMTSYFQRIADELQSGVNNKCELGEI